MPASRLCRMSEPSVSIDRLAVIRAEADRFADVLSSADPAARVPTCPDWSALDLLKHLTQVHQFWAAVVGDRLFGPAVGEFEESAPELPDDVPTLLELRAKATGDLLSALSDRADDEEAWSWFPPDQTVGFTKRMQLHEATMHRVDAELAASVPIGPIAAGVAAQGIDHMIDVMWNWVPPEAERTVTGTVELVATDTGQRWSVRTLRWSGQAWGQTFTDHPGCVRADGGAPEATVSGTAQDLDLLVWTRADRNIVRSGDEAVLAQFQAVLDAGVA